MPVPAERALDLWLKILHEASAVMRVTLGLSTGAVVLFVRFLVGPHQSKAATILIAGSVISFGSAALLCLQLLLGFVNGQMIMIRGAADTTGMSEETLVQNINRWGLRIATKAIEMEILFYLGVLFAFAFVVAAALAGGGS